MKGLQRELEELERTDPKVGSGLAAKGATMNTADPLRAWRELEANVNGRTLLGQVGVRDPEGPCEAFDGLGYSGRGHCKSDGHYLCVECSELAPDAPRFEEYGRDGRRDRLRLFFAGKRRERAKP